MLGTSTMMPTHWKLCHLHLWSCAVKPCVSPCDSRPWTCRVLDFVLAFLPLWMVWLSQMGTQFCPPWCTSRMPRVNFSGLWLDLKFMGWIILAGAQPNCFWKVWLSWPLQKNHQSGANFGTIWYVFAVMEPWLETPASQWICTSQKFWSSNTEVACKTLSMSLIWWDGHWWRSCWKYLFCLSLLHMRHY